ncbi:MAG: dCTP deaminase [Aquificae bacterium]|nr:dCTP deaminase [Aquificota bacterium]
MILNDKTLKDLIKEKELIIEPLDNIQIQASSVDLRLGNEFLVYKGNIGIIDVRSINLNNMIEKKKVDDFFVINPKEFVLATTLEYVKLPDDITAFVEGRSSLGRLGLFIENAGWVDAGFEGNITLEFFNANHVPIKIYPGMRICQLVFAKMVQKAQNPYRGKYFGQRGTTMSKIYMDKY